MLILTSIGTPQSPARVDSPTSEPAGAPARAPFRIGAVQHRWHPHPAEHAAALREDRLGGDARVVQTGLLRLGVIVPVIVCWWHVHRRLLH